MRLGFSFDDFSAKSFKEFESSTSLPLLVRDVTNWLVQAHHPDVRRMPAPSPGRVLSDRTCTALVWNTFRTLALIDPSFWLRQLHARLFEFDDRYHPPESLDVRLWVPVAQAPRCKDRRVSTIDVLLESEDTWWALLTLFETDISLDARDVAGPDPILRAIDALAWSAGARDLFVGLISSGSSTAPVGTRLMRRYQASSHLLEHRRCGASSYRNLRGLGLGTWPTLAAVLDECQRTPALEQPERQAVRRCLEWFGALAVSRDV
jgi:hypothetical protein